MRCLLSDKVWVEEGRVREGRSHRNMRRAHFRFLFDFCNFHLLELRFPASVNPGKFSLESFARQHVARALKQRLLRFRLHSDNIF